MFYKQAKTLINTSSKTIHRQQTHMYKDAPHHKLPGEFNIVRGTTYPLVLTAPGADWELEQQEPCPLLVGM